MNNCFRIQPKIRNEPTLSLFIKFLCVFSQALYDGKWHQLKLLVKPRQAAGFLDDQLVRKVPLEPAAPIYINGKCQLAKRKGTDVTVPVSNGATNRSGQLQMDEPQNVDLKR